LPLSEKFNKSGTQKKPVVLLAPLDWGLGHATRCIPVIQYLIRQGCKVIVAGEGNQQKLLQNEFKNLHFEPLRGYRLKYGSGSYSTILKIILQIPKILASIKNEKTWVNKFLEKHKVDVIISDNRYGFYSSAVPSVFITHQLRIKTPFGRLAESVLQKFNYRLIERFSECWVPDNEGAANLAGELSHPANLPGIPVKYIGRLTRLQPDFTAREHGYLLMILSGPEPQRTIFEKILLKELSSYHGPAILVRGLPAEQAAAVSQFKNLVIHNYLPSSRLYDVINEAGYIISRPGYSTVMDITGRNRKNIFVPTPGQSEQEYLARYLGAQKMCIYYKQKDFSLSRALEEAKDTSFKTVLIPPGNLESVVGELIGDLQNSAF
jgi:UDP-N-acetylglucosamine:LPS N-acetylglucosamine transferase